MKKHEAFPNRKQAHIRVIINRYKNKTRSFPKGAGQYKREIPSHRS